MAERRRSLQWPVLTLLTLTLLAGCGLRASALVTRPAGHVNEDAGPDAEAIAAVDAPAQTRHDVAPTPPDPGGSIDCQGTEEQVNDCLINAPTKSGISATRAKPTLTYQTCGVQ